MENLVIKIRINERDDDGMNVDLHTKVKDMTSREVVHCLADAVNDVFNETSKQCDIPLSFLRLKFIECLTEKTLKELLSE